VGAVVSESGGEMGGEDTIGWEEVRTGVSNDRN
jgi:hypothetical protein